MSKSVETPLSIEDNDQGVKGQRSQMRKSASLQHNTSTSYEIPSLVCTHKDRLGCLPGIYGETVDQYSNAWTCHIQGPKAYILGEDCNLQ